MNFGKPANRTVMVVEDDERIRAFITAGLQKNGYQVVTAANGQEALEFIQRTPPRLVLLDLNMPQMGGWQFLQRRRYDSRLQGVPVIVISGDGTLPRANAPQEGIACLAKPFELTTLVEMVAERCS